MPSKKIISIVTPIYNEEENLLELAKRLQEVFKKNTRYTFEVILIENGSWDQSYNICKKIIKKDKRFKLLKLSRNFGVEGAITAALKLIQGDAAVMMASDLQDPPELIHQFIKKWEEGYENIYQIVTKRKNSNLIRRINSQIFYTLVNIITKKILPKNVSDYRLVDRKVYETINSMEERNRLLRGMFAWTGFKSIGIPFPRPKRFRGESKANTLLVLSLAMRGIFAYSYIPLQIIAWVGCIFSCFSFLFLIITVYKAFVFGVPFDGYGTIIGIILLMFGVLFIFLGIIGKYIGLIYEEVKQRPNYIISEKLGFLNKKKN